MAQGLTRDTDNAWIGGVCSGLARHLNIDVVLLRIIFAFFLLFWLYIIIWIIVPADHGYLR